jgi:hypothetical protein
MTTYHPPSRAEVDAARGNDRLYRALYIREAQRQSGKLASEAATAWDSGKICRQCWGEIYQGRCQGDSCPQ